MGAGCSQMGVSRTYAEKATLNLRAIGVCAMPWYKSKKGWASAMVAFLTLIAQYILKPCYRYGKSFRPSRG